MGRRLSTLRANFLEYNIRHYATDDCLRLLCWHTWWILIINNDVTKFSFLSEWETGSVTVSRLYYCRSPVSQALIAADRMRFLFVSAIPKLKSGRAFQLAVTWPSTETNMPQQQTGMPTIPQTLYIWLKINICTTKLSLCEWYAVLTPSQLWTRLLAQKYGQYVLWMPSPSTGAVETCCCSLSSLNNCGVRQ
jgi:hypothetical protein